MTNEELVEQIQNGVNVKENMGLLYEQNIGFIRKIVHSFSAYAEVDDLMQEAYLGLHKAVEGFDASKGYLFLTYAGSCIKRRCISFIYNYSRTNRIPVHMLQKIADYKKLVSEHHGKISEEIAMKKLNLTKQQYDFMLKTIHQETVLSIDAPMQNKVNDTMTIADCVTDDFDIEHDAIEADCQSRLWEIIDDVLNDRQKDVITSYYLNQRTFTEIAKTMGVTNQRIIQIKDKALSILKEVKEIQDLSEFWGYDSMMTYSGKNPTERIAIKHIELEDEYKRLKKQFENTMKAIIKDRKAYIVERIEELCREKHISKRKLEEEADLGSGSITKWKTFTPRKASLQRVADYFGVELEILIGNS